MVSGRSYAVTSASGIQRESWGNDAATEVHSTVSPSYQFTIPIPVSKFPRGEGESPVEVELEGSIAGSVGKAEEAEGKADESKANGHDVAIGPTQDAKDGLGAGVEIELTKTRLGDAGLMSLTSKPSIEAKVNSKKVEVAISGILKFTNTDETWLHVGGDLKGRVFEVEFEKFKNEGLKSVEGPGLVASLNVSGERTFSDVNMAIEGSATATVSPNWAYLTRQLIQKAVKQGLIDSAEGTAAGGAAAGETTTAGETAATEGTTEVATEAATTGATETAAGGTASTGAALDVATIVGAAAPLLLIAGVGVITALGNEQEDKNQLAATAGREAGAALCTVVEQYVTGYWAVLMGSDAATGPGAVDANQKVQDLISATGKDREAALFDLLYEKNPQQLRLDLRQQLRDRLFNDACTEFANDPHWKAKEGAVEDLGNAFGGDWGMNDTFKTALRNNLYVYEEG